MMIGERLRTLRAEKKMSQGEIQNRTGLLRCYISRVENGHTVPSLETLEKMARALEIPMYQLFYDGQEPPVLRTFATLSRDGDDWGRTGKWAAFLDRLRVLLSKMEHADRQLLFFMIVRMARRAKSQKPRSEPA
jgi:transcriptional regulator with XRE-family HTH domain